MNKKNALIIIFLIIFSILLSGCTSSEENNGLENMDWLSNYLPVHSYGNGTDDFWIDYPSDNPNSSQSVSHLSWVNESVKNGCVLFVVHKTGCESCQPQVDRVIELAEKYKDYVVFYDLDITFGGSIEKRAYDSYLYDPDGPPGYIALTGIFTLIEQNGSIEYGWHSWELDVDYKELEEWVKDSIYYWNKNIGEIR